MDYAALARFAIRNARAVALALIALAAISAAWSFPPRVEGDLIKLLPEGDTSAEALARFQGNPGGEGAIGVTLPPGADRAAVAAALEAKETVRATFYGADGLEPSLAHRLALLQLAPDEVRSITSRLDGAMRFPNPLIQARLLDVGDALRPEVPELVPEDVIFVIPTGPPADTDYAVELIRDVEEAAPGAVWIAGPHYTVADSVREIRADLGQTSLVSLALVLVVVGVAFRDPRVIFLLFAPILLSVALSLAGIQLLMGSLNTYTSLSGAALFGLGVDFGVHLIFRYREERGAGASPPEAVERAWRHTGPPCVTAALTSAAGFLSLTLAAFQGVEQLGFALAGGVLICLLCSLLLLPGMLVWLDPRPSKPPPPRQGAPGRLGGLLAAGLMLTAIAGVGLRNLEVEYDMGALRRQGLSWAEMTEAQRAWRQSAYPPVVVEAPGGVEGRLAERDRLRGAVASGALPQVRAVLSVEDLLPPDQAERLEALAALQAIAEDPRARTLPPPVQEALAPLVGLELAPLDESDLPAGLGHLIGAGRPWVLMFVQGNLLDLREARALRDAVAPLVEAPISPLIANASLYDLMDRDLPRIALAAWMAITLLAAWDLRRPRLVGVAVGGLSAGLIWAGASMGLSGVRVSFGNIVALPILLGIGVDMVIHLLHRLEAEGDVGAALRTTGAAAGVSVATTVVAFLSLFAATNRGLRSIGLAVVIGLIAVSAAALVLVPAAWSALRGGATGETGAGPSR